MNNRVRNSKRTRRIKRNCKNILKLTIYAVILGLVISFFFGGTEAKAASNEEVTTYKYYKSISVKEGDTLWKYADMYSKDGNYEEYMDEVIAINHLKEDGFIIEGMYLTIPYYSEEFVF